MRKLDITRDAYKFLSDLAAKQYRQIGQKMLALLSDPQPADCGPVKGYDGYWRVDFGEYRIVYRFDEDTVYVVLIGKRNDDEVYKQLARK
jgi:mRNA interferase RelE/StbE